MASVSISITSLVGICVWKLEFYIVNSINGGIDVYGAMACVCWIINFSAEDVRRPDNGSKTLSELKFQVTLCSYEITDLILFLGIWY
ncbi:uncharacterized protein [Solanum tuberosum]|uniref:uncharacterized protein isoform X1 n=1 Tax=Solanum tuberosum TaxID=4113 RepID=UPI00073A2280|nr:PREDICTED: uncharacterized protein LOC107061776 isoform X1 [Solanum tuberosum]